MQTAPQQPLRPPGRAVCDEPLDKQACLRAARTKNEAIASIVKNKLLVGTVSDVSAVCQLPLPQLLSVLNQSDRQAECTKDRTKLLGVAAREIIVDGYHVYRTAHERGRNRRQKCCQRLALAGLHFRQRAIH